MADSIDWNELAARVTANFEATGQWFLEPGPSGDVDWNALAAEVQHNFAATGQWFLSTTPMEPIQPEATITGTDGPDELRETLGVDVFLGGAGADSFGFGVRESFNTPPNEFDATILGTGIGPGARDVILDFQQGVDVIDLSSALEWRRRFSFDDGSFDFIGTKPFDGHTNEVRYEVIGDRTIVQMDGVLNQNAGGEPPDGIADAEIELVGVHTLTADDFVL